MSAASENGAVFTVEDRGVEESVNVKESTLSSKVGLHSRGEQN